LLLFRAKVLPVHLKDKCLNFQAVYFIRKSIARQYSWKEMLSLAFQIVFVFQMFVRGSFPSCPVERTFKFCLVQLRNCLPPLDRLDKHHRRQGEGCRVDECFCAKICLHLGLEGGALQREDPEFEANY